MKLFNRELDKGLLFNQFQGTTLRAINSIKSESDFLVKVAQKTKRNKSITHDLQIFRDFRADKLDPEKLQSYLGFEFPSGYPGYNSSNDDIIGGWHHVQSAVFMLRHTSDKPDRLTTFWDFINAHCILEREQVLFVRSTKNISSAEDFLKRWLYLGDTDLTFKDSSFRVIYVINMIMFWSACFELFLELEYESDEHSIVSHILPSWYTKKGNKYFSPSNEKVIESVKRSWAKKAYNVDNISNVQLHRDILVKQYNDKTLDTSKLFTCKEDTIDPNTDAIKKRFQRIGEGQLFTLNQFRTDIAILNNSYAQTKEQLPIIIPFLLTNLFTLCQTDLIEAGCSFESIVNNFASYPSLKSKIRNRYDHFLDSEELRP
ncbi:hypothetical protein [Alteromonas abrolhosensis]|uniref:hypothetical protein n=1 Tax=Alteromonas abrolhosensis TaxID=1892904 RepID=UPI00096B817D|nr:hypothetical protein [Alteromonas abrolhosensis]